MAGSAFNLAGLYQLLAGWKCCKAPSICGAACRGDELTDTLASAFEAVEKKIVELFGEEQLQKIREMMDR